MPSILTDLFSSGSKGYTLGELMTIDPGRIERSEACSVTLKNTYHEVKKASILDKFRAFFSGKTLVNMYYVIFVFNVNSGRGKNHQVVIKCSPDFNLTEWTSNKVEIFCGDCPDFKFRSAYTLGRGDSLFLTDRSKVELGESITKKPKATTRVSFLCKHAYAAAKYLVDNYSILMRTI